MMGQRLRVGFSRERAAAGMSLLAVMRAWEEALLRAGLPLAYSQGKRRTAQISIAAPLPVDVSSSCELLDLWLSERVDPAEFVLRVNAALPSGLEAHSVREVGSGLPSLQSQVRWAEYEVVVPAGRRTPGKVRSAIDRLLSADTLPWEHQRETKIRRYDLRPLVIDVWIEGEGEGLFRLGMRLRTGQDAAGRADQVARALGFTEPPTRVHRRRLYVEETSAAAQAYRRLGEPEGL